MLYIIPIILAVAFLIYKRNFDIFTDKGSIRKFVSSTKFNLIILILLIAQLTFSSVIFYVFWSFFDFALSISQALMAGATSVLLYSISFLIFKSYGPYVMFSFKSSSNNRMKNFLLIILWLISVSVFEGAIFNMTYGISLASSILVSGFVITVISFLAT